MHVHAETPALVDHDFGGREEPLCGIAIQVREKPVVGEVGVFDDVGDIGVRDGSSGGLTERGLEGSGCCEELEGA